MPGEILFSATCTMTANKDSASEYHMPKMRERFFAAYWIVMCMNKSHFPVCYPICMGMPLEQISASVIKCCVLWKRKKHVPLFFTAQDASTTFGKNLHRKNNCSGKNNNMVKKKRNCLYFKISSTRNNTEFKLIPGINIWHTIKLKRTISHTVIKLLHGQDHRRSAHSYCSY